MAGLFDYIAELTEKKKIEGIYEETFNKEYSQFMVNRVFSCDQQLLFLANELNKQGFTNKMHHDFLYHVIPKGKRWIKYSAKKAKVEKELEYIMKYFGCNIQIAKSYYKLLSKDELKEIKDFFEKRGKVK